jgi:tetratricopeptide (TPR) repeat protein
VRQARLSGEDRKHMHHYCDGLRFIDRAYAAMGDKGHMQYNLQRSINNFDRVLAATQESHVMRGEVHVGKARALKLMGRNKEAAAEFSKALAYKHSSPDVYQALADYYHELGNKQKALEMATEGLKLAPNSKALKRRYTEYGGKLPYPDAVDETISAESSRKEIKPEAKPETAPPSGDTANRATGPTELKAPTEQASQIEPPEIGSPKNPYCRFCPPE